MEDPPKPSVPEDEPSPEATELARIDRALRHAAATIMRTQARRAWLVPLLAVPLVELATAPEVPPGFLPYTDEALAEVRAAAERVRAILARLEATPGATLTDDDAYDLVRLTVDHRELINFLFTFERALKERAGVPDDLTGPGLVRRLSTAILDAADPPAVLAVLAAALLSVDPEDPRARDIVPLPDPRYEAVTRAFDQRCFRLGLRTWEDALRHAVATWTPDTWRGLLMAMSFGASKQMGLLIGEGLALQEAGPPAAVLPPPPRRARPRGGKRDAASEAEARIAEALQHRDAARTEAAAARLREAEVVSARDRAVARVAELDRRVAELERELRAAQGARRAVEADLRRLRGEPEPELPPQVAVESPPPDLLRGRTVYFFTGQARAGAREEMADSLREIGADDVRVYHVDEGAPGPEVFPPGAVVVVDTRFVGHRHTEDLKARARRSPGAEYLPLQGGEGGLASRVAERLRRKS